MKGSSGCLSCISLLRVRMLLHLHNGMDVDDMPT